MLIEWARDIVKNAQWRTFPSQLYYWKVKTNRRIKYQWAKEGYILERWVSKGLHGMSNMLAMSFSVLQIDLVFALHGIRCHIPRKFLIGCFYMSLLLILYRVVNKKRFFGHWQGSPNHLRLVLLISIYINLVLYLIYPRV